MSVNSTNPTSDVCRPLYYEDYFIFDRDDLLTLSTSVGADLTSVINQEGSLVNLFTPEMRTVTVSSCYSSLYTEIQLSVYEPFFSLEYLLYYRLATTDIGNVCIHSHSSIIIGKLAYSISAGYIILGFYCGVSESSAAQCDLLLLLLSVLCHSA